MKMTVRLGVRSYDVIMKSGSLSRIGQLVNLRRKVMIVTDTGVPAQYADAVARQAQSAYKVVLPAGEQSKSLQGYAEVLRALLENGFTRHDCVVAVGGGVMGDLAGFAAATYMRGIDFINCPTTTLSQIDSSVGGKTAVNFENTKNIVGAFYQPKCVVIDPDTLQTLPRRHVVNGLVEALKAGLIADEALFALFEEGDIDANREEIIQRSLQMKRAVVENDETEQGRRAILNFGHTIGHAIEGLHLDEWYHGECVGLGMLPMLENDELRERVRAVLQKLGLQTQITDSADALYKMMLHDKKADAQTITVVKVAKAGEAKLEKITYPQLQALIREAAHA